MRVFDFPSVEVYEIFFEGLLATTLKGPELRVLNKVVTKMEEIGTPKIIGGVPHTTLYTLAENKPIEIEDAQYDLVKRVMNEIAWNTRNIKLVDRLLEFLDTAPTPEEYQDRKNGILAISK